MSTRVTRGRKSGSEQQQPSLTPREEPGKQSGNRSGTISFNEASHSAADGRMETQLRKRRRTGSSPADHTSPAPKRTQPDKAAVIPHQRRQTKTRDEHDSTITRNPTSSTPVQTTNTNEPIGGDALSTHETDRDRNPQPLAMLDGSTVQANTNPDFNTVIADIIDHGDRVDNHYALYNAKETLENGHLGASFTLKTQSLPVLENLATQILEIMAKSTYHEILTIATKPDTDPGQAYATLKSLFDHTKKVYSVQEPFLNPQSLGLVDSTSIDIIRKANVATFVSSVFGSQDVGFFHLNENFVDTFVADGGRLLKTQAQLFLDLKTQAYISAVQSTDRSTEAILEDLFPSDLGDRLLGRRPGAKQLAPSEAEFVQRASNRRKMLLDEASNQTAIKNLPDKYIWEDFLRNVNSYVSKNLKAITGVATPKAVQSQSWQTQQSHEHQRPPQPNMPPPSARTAHPTDNISSTDLPTSQSSPPATIQSDVAEKRAQAARFGGRNVGNTHSSEIPHQGWHQDESQIRTTTAGSTQEITQIAPQIQYHFEHPLHPESPVPPPPYFQDPAYQQSRQQWDGQIPSQGQLHPTINTHAVPYPTQSAPTQILYERARMAATSKASPSSRRSGHTSQRRPWTTDEETCLMAGLDRVKGPHWSQILAMFGPGGTISEVLKDRNQVQLKDKARNLKLFFLKSGIEVPYYLQFVTGELKTRAPGQAAKHEARNKGTTDEDRAHVEGLMLLAGSASLESDHSRPMPVNSMVPTADMGVDIRSANSNNGGVLIDPEVTGSAHVEFPNGSTATETSTLNPNDVALAKAMLLQQGLRTGGF